MKEKCSDCPYVGRGASFYCPEEEGNVCPHLARVNKYNPAKVGGS